jgi:uncharacterized delta-60 repeat protein
MELQIGRSKGKRKAGTAVAFTFTLAALPAVCWGQAGQLDGSFGSNGSVFSDFGGDDRATGMVVQPDGKIVAVGWSRQNGVDGFGIARYTPDGALDPSFGSSGKLSFTDQRLGQHYAIALQADGKIVVGGSTNALGTDDFILARFLPNGRLDTRFGKKGLVITDFGITDVVAAIAIQPDGKIVAAGSASSNSNDDFAVARYRPNGSLDKTFGRKGKVRTDFLGGFDNAASIALQPDGRIVVAGWADGPAESHPAFAAARYRSNGVLDTSFGGDGKITTNIGEDARATSVVFVNSIGKLVLAGWAIAGQTFSSMALARYHLDGTLDESFGDSGTVLTSTSEDVVINDLAVQPDGKLLAGGFSTFGLIIARYLGNGLLDNSFSDDGRAEFRFNDSSPVINAIALQPTTGRFVVAGYSFASFDEDFVLARFFLAP